MDDIHIMNLGLKETHKVYEEYGRAVVIEPIDDNAREILPMLGKDRPLPMKLLLYWVRRDVDTAEFTPLLRRNVKTGRVGMVIVPIEPTWNVC